MLFYSPPQVLIFLLSHVFSTGRSILVWPCFRTTCLFLLNHYGGGTLSRQGKARQASVNYGWKRNHKLATTTTTSSPSFWIWFTTFSCLFLHLSFDYVFYMSFGSYTIRGPNSFIMNFLPYRVYNTRRIIFSLYPKRTDCGGSLSWCCYCWKKPSPNGGHDFAFLRDQRSLDQ